MCIYGCECIHLHLQMCTSVHTVYTYEIVQPPFTVRYLHGYGNSQMHNNVF